MILADPIMILADPISYVGQSASLYSQIAGVLAGFAFTVLISFLGRAAPESVAGRDSAAEGEREALAVVLFTTLAALIICAVLFGLLAGGQNSSGNSMSGMLFYALPFILAILSIFYATGLAALPYTHLGAMLTVVRILICVASPVFGMMMIATAANDICSSTSARCNQAGALDALSPPGFGMLLAAVIMLVSIVALVRNQKRPIDPIKRARLATGVAAVVLITAVAQALPAVVLDAKPASFTASHWALYLVEGLSAVILSLFSLLTLHSLRPSTTQPHAPREHETVALSGDERELLAAHNERAAVASTARHGKRALVYEKEPRG
jgi:hypothetical protein